MLKRRAYISQLAFYSDAPVFLIHNVFKNIAEVVSREVNESFGKPLPYHPNIARPLAKNDPLVLA